MHFDQIKFNFVNKTNKSHHSKLRQDSSSHGNRGAGTKSLDFEKKFLHQDLMNIGTSSESYGVFSKFCPQN